MRASCLLAFFCFCVPALVPAREAENTGAREKAALLEEIRDRIIWYSEERDRPLLIPEDVFALASVEDLPVSAEAYISIRNWLSGARIDAQNSGEHSFGDCNFPVALPIRVAPPIKQVSLEEAMASRTTTLLVRVDNTTVGLRPNWGIYQYNQATPIRVLAGSGVHNEPLLTRAFLSEGGALAIEGATYCSKSPWHPIAPRKGDVYLLLGSIDNTGVFDTFMYFRIADGDIVPAAYPALRSTEIPLPLEEVMTRFADSRKAGEIWPGLAPPKGREKQPESHPSGPRGLTQGEAALFCEEFQGLCDTPTALAWRRQEACRWECTSQSYHRDKSGSCHWECGPPPTSWQREPGSSGVGPRIAFLNLREGDSLAGRPTLYGFAMDFSRVAMIDLYWNGRRVSARLATGMPSPEACSLPLGLPHSACIHDSGFLAEADTTQLDDGLGRLAVVATDVEGWTSSLELAVVIANKK